VLSLQQDRHDQSHDILSRYFSTPTTTSTTWNKLVSRKTFFQLSSLTYPQQDRGNRAPRLYASTGAGLEGEEVLKTLFSTGAAASSSSPGAFGIRNDQCNATRLMPGKVEVREKDTLCLALSFSQYGIGR